jgi:hypothetical protein
VDVHRVSDDRQIEVHTAEPLVPDPSPCKVEITTVNFKRYKSPGSVQIPAEWIQARGEILPSEIHKLIKSIWNMEQLSDQWNESIILPIYDKGHQIYGNIRNCGEVSLLSTSYKILSTILRSRLSSHIDEIIEDHQCVFRLRDQLLSISFAFVRY